MSTCEFLIKTTLYKMKDFSRPPIEPSAPPLSPEEREFHASHPPKSAQDKSLLDPPEQGSILPNADSKSLHSHELDQTLPEGFLRPESHELDQTLPEGFLSLPPEPESHELDQTLPEGFLSLPLKPDLSLPSDNSDNFMNACDTFMSADKLDLTVSTTRVNRASPSGSTEDNSIEFRQRIPKLKIIRQQILEMGHKAH
jgi:hypothetical protein